MKALAQSVQLIAVVLIAAAAVPVMLNALGERRARAAQEAAARDEAVLAAAAAEAGDHDLAGHAYAAALARLPDRGAEHGEWRQALVRAHTEQILQNPGALTARNVLRLQSQLGVALAGQSESDARVLLAFGRILQFRGKAAEAQARFKQAAERDDKLALAHLLYGDSLLKAGTFDEAEKALARAVELDPELALARFALGQVKVAQKKWDDAAPLLEEAVKKMPGNAQAQLALGKVQLNRQKWKEAEAALERALALQPDLHVVHAMLGDVYAQNGRIEAAQGALRLAYERSGDVEALKRLGRMQARLNRPNEALEIYNQIRAVNPDDAEPHCQIGAASEALGNVDVAKAAYAKCVELSVGQPEALQVAQQAAERLRTLETAPPPKPPRR